MTDAYAPYDPRMVSEHDAGGYEVEPAGEVVYLPQPAKPRLPPKLAAFLKSPNIADDLDDDVLTAIGSKVIEEYDIDVASRVAEKWVERNEKALKLAMQVGEEKSFPWPNASNVKYPLIATAAIQFNARAYPAIVPGVNLVKVKTMGKPSDEKRARAARIGPHMSYQLLEEMDGWEEDTDRLLVMLPIAGTVFRKTWFNPIKGKNDSEIVTADKLVVNYWAKPLDACPRVTQVCEYYPHEVLERFRSGAWREFNIGISPAADNDDDAKHEFLEQHRLWDLDEDGYPEPYVCTVHKETGKVVRVVARFDEDGVSLDAAGEVVCIAPVQYFTKYGFIPAMDGGFYDIGFGQLLDAINDTINTTFNQLMDAGSLQNAGGGFIGGNVVKGGSVTFRLGEWKRIDASGADLKNAIVPMPAHGPSAVLFNLLGLLVEAAKDITATKDILTGETGGTANVPVGTTLAMIEQGLKTFTAIFKRVHRSLKQELKALARLNSLYLEDEAYYTYQDQEGVIARQDYAAGDCDVVPVSDPTVVTDMQKVGQAQALLSFLGKGLDDSEIIRRALEAFSIQDIEGLMPKGPQPPPPEVLEMQAKLKLEEGKLALKADDNEIKRQGQVLAAAQAEADIDLKAAQAAKTAIEAMLLGPQFQAQLQQMIVDATMQAAGHDQVDRHKAADAALQARGQDMTAQAKAAQAQGMADGQVQPGIASGMEGLGPDQAVPGLPQGPPVGPGPAMGAGGELGVGYAGQGGAPGGDGQP